MSSSTAKLKEGIRKAFAEFYDEDTAETLADVHVSYHVRFAQQLTQDGGPATDAEALLNHKATARLGTKLRRTRKDDVLPKGPKTDALMDEIVDFIASAGETTMADVQNVASALGSEPGIVRTAISRLVRLGRIERVGGAKDQKTARYKCT